MKKFGNFLLRWLPFAAVICMVALLVYTSEQQILRRGAYDPEIQMAEDLASGIARNERTGLNETAATIDVANSLAPFVMLFDMKGKVLQSSGSLNGKTPDLPIGVLDASRVAEHRLTWEPTPGVRLATVIVPVSGAAGSSPAFVLVARNMHEVEALITFIGWLVLGSWVLAMLITAILIACRTRISGCSHDHSFNDDIHHQA